MFAISQPLVPFEAAVVMPLPLPLPVAVYRLSAIQQDRIRSNQNYSPQIASIIESKMDKMVYNRSTN